MNKTLFARLISSAFSLQPLALSLTALLLPFAAIAATGDPDSFDPGPNGSLYSVMAQPDGKILLGGGFTTVKPVVARNCIARFNADGTLDTNFNPTASAVVLFTAVQGDGKILLGGAFSSVGGVARGSLARLNADNSLDMGFNPNMNDTARGVALQADGKIVLGGGFTTVSGITRLRLARVNADGTLDSGFNPASDGQVESIALRTDGKILVGGTFTTVGGIARTNIAQLNGDGTLDTSFTASAKAPGGAAIVQVLAVQADGKILMGGSFTNVNGVARSRIARLNSDGTLDTSFTASADAVVDSLALQADGKILMGGAFTNVNGVARVYLARLNADGTLDSSLNSAVAVGNGVLVESVALQADGKILLGGTFTSVGGLSRLYAARLANDAATQSLTATANRVEWLRGGTAPEVQAVAFELSTNGGGSYTSLGNGTRIGGGWELTGLSLPIGGQIRARARTVGGNQNASSSSVETVALFGYQPELAVAGNGTDIADGDSTPSVSDGTDFGVNALALGAIARTFTITNSGNTNLTLGNVAVGGVNAGNFSVTAQPATTVGPGGSTTFQVTFTPDVYGLRSATLSFSNNDSNENPFNFNIQATVVVSLDAGFNPNASGSVYGTAVQPDGKILVVGEFGLARFNANGTLDAGYNPNVPGPVYAVAVQPDGRILLGGGFGARRVNEDGTLDTGFNPNADNVVWCIALQPDGKILLGGAFLSVRGQVRSRIARVNADGTLDTGFDPKPNDVVHTVAVQPDGKILLGGRFTALQPNGGATTNISRIARLNADGTLDTGFANSAPDGLVLCLAVQADGKVLMGGGFLTVGGVTRFFIARLNTDGTLDPGFNPAVSTGVYSLALQADGKIVMGGLFTSVGGITRNRTARLNADGTLDLAFDPNANNAIYSVALQADGKVLLGGDFTSMGGVARNHLARMENETATQSLTIPAANRVQWLRGASSPESPWVTFELSTDGGMTYTPLGFGTRIAGGWELTGLSLPANGLLRARAQTHGGNDNGSSGLVETVLVFGNFTEIAVSGNGINIVDGDSIPSASDSTDIGAVPIASGSITRTFTITNRGNLNLTIGNVTVGGTHAADFVVSAQPAAATLAPNGSTTFQVTFDPSASGLRSATLSFTNNDSDENPFNFSIQGAGNPPEIAVIGNSLNIVDGDSTPSLGDHTDFGSFDVASGTVIRIFTITNSGLDSLALGSVTIGGNDAADFVVSVQPAATVAVNGSTTFQVTFDSSAGGPRNATLSFTNNDYDENPFNFSIQGTGIDPEIAVTGNGLNIADGDSTPDPADLTDFGSANLTGGVLFRTFTITNSGSTNLTLGAVTVSGTAAADFVVSSQPLGSVGPNGSTTFQVTFDPSAVGLRSAILSFTNNDGDENPFDFSIQGTGVASEIAVTGNSLDIADGDSTPSLSDGTDFGNVAAASGSVIHTFTITNLGSGTLTLGAVTVGGTHAGDFEADLQPLGSVGPNGSTTFQVTFGPSAGGLRSATLSFINNDPDESPFDFNIQGTGLVPEIAVTGNAVNIADGDSIPSLSDHTDFGSVTAASDSVIRTFTITNSGLVSLTLGSVTVGGTHAADFVVSTEPSPTVAPNGSTTFQVTFHPNAAGLRIATLSFSNNDSDEDPFNFSIQGTGTTPEISVSGHSVFIADGDSTPSLNDHTDFGSVVAASGTVIRTFTINNSGGGNLALGAVTIGGANASDFTVTTPPTSPVAPNGSNTTFQVTFDPSAIGLRSATLSFTNNDSDENPFNFSIQGAGMWGVDAGFNPDANDLVYTTTTQPNGKVLLGGDFSSVGGVARNHVARLNVDGTLDASFNPGSPQTVQSLAVQPDGKILLGGIGYLARFNADGTQDTAFTPNPNDLVSEIALQPDGKILIGGDFTVVGGLSRRFVTRLNANGTLDTGFVAAVSNGVYAIALQPDGKVIIGGDFVSVGGATHNRLARLNADGTLDGAFNPTVNNRVLCTRVQPDGKILLAGFFTSVNGVTHNRVARLNSDGTLDAAFNPSPANVISMALQTDGKIILAGQSPATRLNADGTVDVGFNFSTDFAIQSAELQPDGKVLLAGDFLTVGGVPRNHVARMENEPATQSLTIPSANRVQWLRGGSSPETHQVTFELSTDGGTTYTPLGFGTRIAGGWELTGLSLPTAGYLRARAVTIGGYGSSGLAETVLAFGNFSEIAVSGNGVNITNYDDTLDFADHADFGSVNVTGGTLVRTFTITNLGNTNLTLGTVTITLGQAADFAVSAQPATTVAPNGSTTLQITFDPSAAGLRRAWVDFANNDSDENPVGFNIQGAGIGAEIAVAGNGLNIADGDSVPDAAYHTDFGSVNINGSTLIRTFTITNSGNVNLTLGSVAIAGTHAADFAVSAQPTATVAPNGSTTFQVTFDPSAIGLRSATLSFTNNDSDENPFDFNIQGTGIGPEITVTGNSVNITNLASTPNLADHTDFGLIATTNGIIVRTFFITNSGAADLTLGTVTVGGTHAADFAVSTQPTATVGPTGSATFGITFDPSAVGLRTATLSFTNNDSDENPFTFSIQGTGYGPEIAVTGNSLNITNHDVTPDLADHTDFGNVGIGSTLVRTFTITNSGTASLTLGSVTLSGQTAGLSVTAQPATSVAANGSTTFQVSFQPSSLGQRIASLTFANNDSDENPFTFTIYATGVFSSDANLAALTLSRGTLSPVFAPATTNYTASVAYGDTNLTVTATRAQANATLQVQINGASYANLTSGSPSAPLALNIGTNTVNVRVTAHDGVTTRIYTVTVIRRTLGAGDLDPLNPTLVGTLVYATAVQPDGKTIIAGTFTSVLGVARTNIARLNADGTLDLGFNPNPNGDIASVAVQTDGKVLLGGLFTSLQPNGAASATGRNCIARVNADGTLDAGFDPNANNWVRCFAVQGDGRILMGGHFTTLQPNGGVVTNRSRIARLNADGTLDTSFDPNANNIVQSVALQADGKVLLGGLFTTLQPNGAASATNRNYLARVNADGTLDYDFDPKPNTTIRSLVVQANGKVLVAGEFTTLQPNGGAVTNRNFIARVNPDGTLDAGFDPKANNSVSCVAVQADGKVLLGGLLSTLQPNGAPLPTTRQRIARVNPDGTLDTGFDPSANGLVYSVAVQADGQVLLGGGFSALQPNGAPSPTTRNRFARLLNDPATQSLTNTSASAISWTRGGSSPEVSLVTFELSTDGGANWTALGNGVRVGTTANWQLTGLALPASGQLRARGRTTGGYNNGSPGLLESVASFVTDTVVVPPVIDPQSLKRLGNGAFQFSFSNTNNTAFTVLAATNVSQPLSNWTALGGATNLGGGLYQFTDSAATNFARRCYRLRFP